jgi:branched-chain amino acid transport system permease protein
MLFYSFLFKFYYVTGGDEGMRVLQPRLLGGFAGLDKIEYLTGPYYYYALALLVLATLLMRRIVTSPFGLYLRSIRENADKAEYLGVDFRRQRFVAFLIAGVFGAVGGALVIIPTGLADPLLAYWTHSGTLVFMLLLGGFTNFFGPIVGAFVFIFLQDQVMAYTEYWRFIFGAILAVVVIFFPHGVMGVLDPRARAGV